MICLLANILCTYAEGYDGDQSFWVGWTQQLVDGGFGNFKGTWHTAYVSRMYLDNTQNEQRSLPAYSISNLSLEYTVLPMQYLKQQMSNMKSPMDSIT